MAVVHLFLLSLMVLCFAMYVYENERNMMQFKVEFLEKMKELNKKTDLIRKDSSKHLTQIQVAFSASLQGDLHRLQDHKTILYDREVTDTANAYDPGTGVFTVPVTGVYVFIWSVVGYYQATELTVDGNPVASALIDAGSSGDLGSGSQTVIIAIKQHQHVNIRTGQIDGDRYLRGTNYNSFSGWLLFMNE